jgi:hypothetical protein
VEVTSDPVFRSGPPKILFDATTPGSQSNLLGAGGFDRNPRWVPTPDGKKFLAVMTEEQEIVSPLTVVVNWQNLLKKSPQ